MVDKTRLYTVSELAEEFCITPRTIRFYEDKKLLSPRRAGSNRVFDYRDVIRLTLVLRFKRLGFELSEIKDYLDLYQVDESGEAQLKDAYQKLSKRIRQLEEQMDDLKFTLDELAEIKEDTVKRLEDLGVKDLPEVVSD